VSHVLLALLLSLQTPPHTSTGWPRVQELTAGTRVSLTYTDGRSEDRVVEGTSQSQLLLRTRDRRVSPGEIVPRETILEIAIERRRRGPTGAIIGAIGGFVWGLSLSGLQCTTAGCALGVGAVDGVLGALIGQAVSPAHATREVIYRANPLPENPI
jgi:hypothetical protein